MDALVDLLDALEPLLTDHDTRFVPALDEALAAEAIVGTQALDLFPHSHHDGVLGAWIGSASGLERALSVVRRASYQGVSRFGGALVLVGDDPSGASTGMPTYSESALAHAFVPVFYPADAAEILSLGRHALAISRFAGTWVSLKLVRDVVAGGMIVTLERNPFEPQLPKLEFAGRAFEKRLEPSLRRAAIRRSEHELVYERLEAVQRYADLNELNPVEHRHARDRLGIVASGRLYRELQSAFELLGLDAAALGKLGIRVLRLQLLYPIPKRRLREFAEGLSEVIVLDDRRGFIEDQIRIGLCDLTSPPRVLGQRDRRGAPWLARHAEVTAESLALDLGPYLARQYAPSGSDLPVLQRLHKKVDPETGEARIVPVQGPDVVRDALVSRIAELGIARHRLPSAWSVSEACSRAEESSAACPSGEMGPLSEEVYGVGSVSSWIGLAPYIHTRHRFVRLPRTLPWHRSRLVIQAAIDAGVTVTYVLQLHSISGGRDERRAGKPVGDASAVASERRCRPSRADCIRALLAEGVAHVVARIHDPAIDALAERDPRVEVVRTQNIEQMQQRLAAQSGVSLWIEQEPADSLTELQRRVPVWAFPPESFGPSWSELFDIEGEWAPGPAYRELEQLVLDEPDLPTEGARRVQLCASGPSAERIIDVIVRAAEIEGLHAVHLACPHGPQPAASDWASCILSSTPIPGSARVVLEGASCVFASSFELPPSASGDRVLSPERSLVLLHRPAAPDRIVGTRSSATDVQHSWDARCRELQVIDARELCRSVLGAPQHHPMVLLGMAAQRGRLPFASAGLECAIRDRESDLEGSLLALRLGRAVVAAPEVVERWMRAALDHDSAHSLRTASASAGRPDDPHAILERALAPFTDRRVATGALEALSRQARELADYQDLAYATRFASVVEVLLASEARSSELRQPLLSVRAADVLAELMLTPDFYESARQRLRGRYRLWLEGRSKRLRLRHRLRSALWPTLQRTKSAWEGAGSPLPTAEISVSARWGDWLLAVVVSARRLRNSVLDPARLSPRVRLLRARREFGVACLGRLGELWARRSSEGIESDNVVGFCIEQLHHLAALDPSEVDSVRRIEARIETRLEGERE